jgi:5-carboxymethyl-2-hydroxymuconate isomerase
MPHIIVEYSANIESEISPQRLVDEMHEAAVGTGIAEVAGFRTRAERRQHFRVGDGNPKNGFVHVLVRIRDGRSVEQRKALAETLMKALEAAIAPVLAARPMALGVEVQEIDSNTRLLRNTIREQSKASAA